MTLEMPLQYSNALYNYVKGSDIGLLHSLYAYSCLHLKQFDKAHDAFRTASLCDTTNQRTHKNIKLCEDMLSK